MGAPNVDPQEFLDRLRADHQVLRWEPLAPDAVRRPIDSHQVKSGESLEYLHRHWILPDAFDAAAAPPGVRGRLVRFFGRLTYRVLSPYFSQERDLLAHMVRVNDALERRCDELTGRIQQLNQDMVERQVAEARNQAALAVWLHAQPPAPSPAEDGAPSSS